jgi:prepilin-type N-terminal cleavage/methylation domain-containing protein
MKLLHSERAPEPGRRGMTMIEISIASLLFTVIAYGMVSTASMGIRAEQSMSRTVVDTRALHDACAALEEEISYANLATVEHEIDEQGFSTLTFQVPVVTDLGVAWGAYDKRLGKTEVERAQADWHVKYVSEIVPGTGEQRCLVRYIENEADEMKLREILIDRISSTAAAPGFVANDTGSLWVLTVRLPADDNDVRQEAVIHVRTRN